MGDAQNANAVAVLASGANPRWIEQTDLDTSTVPTTVTTTGVEGAPSSTASGSSLAATTGIDALRTLVALDLRVLAKSHDADDADVAEVHHRIARFSIDAATFDGTGEYTINIGGTAGTTAAQPYADVPAALAAVKAAVDAVLSATVSTAIIDADDDGDDDTLVLTGVAEADYVITAFSTTGTGTVNMVADAATAALRVWTYPGGVLTNTGYPPSVGWKLANDGSYEDIDYRGFVERIDTSGLGRLYLEVYDVDGPAGESASVDYAYRAWIGPAIKVGEQ